MDADNKRLAQLSRIVTEISSVLVDSRRSMMVFRARMRQAEKAVAGIGDNLGILDARFLEIRRQALRAAAKSRDTIDLCELLLEPGDEGKH